MNRYSKRTRPVRAGRKSRSQLIGSVAKTVEVLEVFGEVAGPLTIAALVRATGRPKSSLHRILSTLVHTGLVEQDPATGAYHLTLKMWSIGTSALAGMDILRISRPHLEALSQATDETVHLAVLEAGGNVIYLSKVESLRSIRVQTQVGSLVPSWCTATGRAILAFLPEMRDRVLSGPLEQRTPHTVTDADDLRSILAHVAEQGYVVTEAENHPEMGGIAAPIRDHTGETVASCGIAIPVFRMDQKLVDRCVPLVLQAAAAISAELGYRSRERR